VVLVAPHFGHRIPSFSLWMLILGFSSWVSICMSTMVSYTTTLDQGFSRVRVSVFLFGLLMRYEAGN